MDHFPVNVRLLLESIIGIEALSDEERNRIVIKWLKIENEPIMNTVTLHFRYISKKNRCFNLQYELAGNRGKRIYFMHVMYVDNYYEQEFPDFRQAVDFCDNQE